MATKIDTFCAADRPEWEGLWQGYLEFYETDLSPEVTDATWRRLINPSGDIQGLCGRTEEGLMTGIVHFLFHPVTWSIEKRCYLEDLFVSPADRGSGTGRLLIEAVYAAADAQGADQVYWLTQETNETARKLYDRVATKTAFVKYRR